MKESPLLKITMLSTVKSRVKLIFVDQNSFNLYAEKLANTY